MSIKMGTRNTTADEDEVIKSVRAIVFNDKNELAYNDVSDASINADDIHRFYKSSTGYNNIYIICNETPELTEELAAITLKMK
ncbi:MAG: fimbrial protein [Bacteroides xylanisolvens]